MRCLLDTSAYIDLHDPGFASQANPLDKASSVLVSVVTMAELLAGFKRHGLSRRENEFRQFLLHPRVEIADIDRDTAEFFAEIHGFLRKAGKPVPTNDLWIAATAMQHGARVLTSDRHFLQLPQLIVEFLEKSR